MKGWLLYDKAGAERNAWFINHMKEEGEKLGLGLCLVTAEEFFNSSCAAQKKGVMSEYVEKHGLPDFAAVRTINPQINKFFEERGVKCFNNYKTSFVANDKFQTYLFAQRLGVPVLPTRLLSDMVNADGRVCAGAKNPAYPVVVKSRRGHGGSEVFLLKDGGELEEFVKNHNSSDYICQPMCSEPGLDVRVYLLGGKVIASAERRSHTDFRSNFSLGGLAGMVSATPTQKGICSALFKSLGCDFVGVDFIRHRGEWLLNEVEDSVGTRMLYKLTDTDAAALYLRHICASIKK